MVGFALVCAYYVIRERNTSRRIQVSEDFLLATLRSGKVVRLLWSELKEAVLVTRKPNFMDDDVYWELVTKAGTRVRVPTDIPGSSELLQRLGRLTGFDHAAAGNAFRSVKAGRHYCWHEEKAKPGI
jgi:hypothetical protein